MKSKISLALALALFALGINQANAAMVYFSCVGDEKSQVFADERIHLDLIFDTQSKFLNGPRGYLGGLESGDDKVTSWTCEANDDHISCNILGGWFRYSNYTLSRISGHLKVSKGAPLSVDPKGDKSITGEYDCKLAPKKLF